MTNTQQKNMSSSRRNCLYPSSLSPEPACMYGQVLAVWRPSPTRHHYTHPNIHQGRRAGFSVLAREWRAPGIKQTSVKQFTPGPKRKRQNGRTTGTKRRSLSTSSGIVGKVVMSGTVPTQQLLTEICGGDPQRITCCSVHTGPVPTRGCG